MSAEKMIELTEDVVADIREMLTIGLFCYGQIDELAESEKVAKSLLGKEWPEGAKVIHPTGTTDVPRRFAEALMNLNV